MHIDITDQQGNLIECCQTLPPGMQALDIRGSIPFLFQGEAFRMLLQEFRGNGCTAWYNRFWAQRDTALRARGDIPVLELRIGWTNQLRGDWEKVPQASLKPGEFNLTYTPHIDTTATLDAGKHYATFDLHVERSLLDEMGMVDTALGHFLEKVDKDQPAELSPHPQHCPAAMMDAVQFLLTNPYSAGAQSMFLEWTTRQILLIALETAATPRRPVAPTLTARDIEGLYTVKQFIADAFPQWPGQTALCRKGELNAFKLKSGFRRLFKMSVYDYHMQLKFQEAKRLLLENKETITAIAYQIGYDHAHNFTLQFKKQFGYTPSWFQKHGRM
jgi:AraC family transcriptional regulator, transcriptional activator of the genes for pyochelin and ferripyochelin receptors